MKPAKVELLAKVVSWRFLSMLYGFSVAYLFTGNVGESAGIVFLTGTTLTFFQWGFEIIWDRHARHRIRNALSRQHGRVGWLVRWGRGPRNVSMDKHEQGADRGEAWEDPSSPKNAGREWT